MALFSSSRRSVLPVPVAVALVGFGLLFASCTGDPETSAPTIRPVRVAVAEEAGRGTDRAFSGRTRASIDSRLSFRVGGTIVRMEVGVGEALTAGQLVAALDPQDYQTEVRATEARLLQAEAEEKNAAASYQRLRALYADDRVSLSAFDAARAGAQTTAALADVARERVQLTRQQLEYTRLVAPRSGFVTSELAQRGEYVQPGQPVVELGSAGPLEVEALVPESIVGALRIGMPATVQLPAASSSALDAVVSEVGVAPRPGEAGYPVILRFTSAPETVRPGLAARVAFNIETPANVGTSRVIVPTIAVAEDVNGRFVYVVERLTASNAPETPAGTEPLSDGRADGVIARRTVRTGELTRMGLEILHGLRPGEFVVTAGLGQLREGDRVRLPREDRQPLEDTDESPAVPTPSRADASPADAAAPSSATPGAGTSSP